MTKTHPLTQLIEQEHTAIERWLETPRICDQDIPPSCISSDCPKTIRCWHAIRTQLHQLLAITKVHFQHEEAYLATSGKPSNTLRAHLADHTDITRTALGLMARLDSEPPLLLINAIEQLRHHLKHHAAFMDDHH